MPLKIPVPRIVPTLDFVLTFVNGTATKLRDVIKVERNS